MEDDYYGPGFLVHCSEPVAFDSSGGSHHPQFLSLAKVMQTVMLCSSIFFQNYHPVTRDFFSTLSITET